MPNEEKDNMGLFTKYLDKEDKNELRLRQEQINMQKLILVGLEQLKNNWIVSKFSKYGLDSTKQWYVNPISGQIKEVKPEKKK